MNIALIGAGAIGAVTSELLIRLGCERITIIDNDHASIGNFSRHTLRMDSLPLYKAHQLASDLNNTFPFAKVISKASPIESVLLQSPELLAEFDLIIDATANDAVLILLETQLEGRNTILISLSTSIEARRLYCYMIRTQTTRAYQVFSELMQPWNRIQQEEVPNPQFPLEGIGCWHPIFPARLDDIWSVTSPAIRQIESFIESSSSHCLSVIERNDDGSITVSKEPK